jgi:predicted outer membrane protein
MKGYVVVAALVGALIAPAAAQQAVVPQSTAAPIPTTAEGFRRMALMSDAFEIASSRLALERSRNGIVRRFAEDMVQQHSMTTQALLGGAPAVAGTPSGAVGGAATGAVVGGVLGGPAGAAVGAGVGAGAGAAGAPTTTGSTAVPALDARHAAMLEQLAGARGRQFDRLYGDMQRAAHREAVAMFTAYAQQGTDPAMRTFAQQALPHLQRHLARAQRLPGAS